MAALQQRPAPGRKEPGRHVDRLVEVFGLDDGMLPAALGDLVGHKLGVVRIFGPDLLGRDDEDPLHAVQGLLPLQGALFTPQIVGRGPDRAHVERGGVGRAAHGREAAVDDRFVLVLGFVDDQQQIGRGPFGPGLGVAAEKGAQGRAQAAADRLGLGPDVAGGPEVVEPVFQAGQTDGDLAGGRVDVDDAGLDPVKEGQQEADQLGNGLIFAGLAGEAGVDHGVGRADLVAAQGYFGDQAGEEADGEEDFFDGVDGGAHGGNDE